MGDETFQSPYSEAKAVVISAPYDKTATYVKGTAKGPQAILQASSQVELYDIELDKEIYKIGIHTYPELTIREESPEKMVSTVQNVFTKVLNDGKFPMMLGGEHSVSIGSFFACIKKYPNLSVLHLDAHTDMRKDYEGSPFNHACVLYQMRLLTKKTVSVGIRSMDKSDMDFIREDHAPIIYDYEIQAEGLNEEKIISHLTDDVYVTIDLDGFEPSLISSVGTPEPGGLKWYPTLKLLRNVFKKKNVVACDVVELCPEVGRIASDFAAAKLVYKLIGYKFG